MTAPRGLFNEHELRVNEIFESISGEGGGFPQGTWTTFLRLQGCNLDCVWCDTEDSIPIHADCEVMTIQEALDACTNKHVLITGGEPLLQHKALANLIPALHRWDKVVQIETSGSLEFPVPAFNVAPPLFKTPIHWVVDYKCPGSGMANRMPDITTFVKWIENARAIGDQVHLKWVLADHADLKFAIEKIEEIAHGHKVQVPQMISPLDGRGAWLPELVEEIRKLGRHDILDQVYFSIQLHKIFQMP